MKAALALLLASLAPCARGAAFASAGRGTSAAGFLRLGVGARALAMGEAATAAVDDASALYWNPAGLTRARARSVLMMYGGLPGDAAFGAAAIVQPLGRWSVGAGAQYLDYGSIAETDSLARDVGAFKPRDLSAGAGAAYDFGPFSAGLGLKRVSTTVLRTASALAADLGVQSAPLLDERLRLGLAVVNAGGSLKLDQEYDPLPLTARAGVSWKAGPSWLLAADAAAPRDGAPYGALGAEWGMTEAGLGFFLRGGLNTRALADGDGLSGLSLGFGARARAATFDYALITLGSLGLTHRLSVSLRLGREAGAAASEAAYDAGARARRGRALEREGREAYLAGDLARATERYQAALEQAENLPAGVVADAQAGLGLCQLKAGQDARARESFRASLAGQPGPSQELRDELARALKKEAR